MCSLSIRLLSSPPQAGDLIVESLVSVTNPRRRQHFKNALRQLGVLDPVARRGEMRGQTGQGGAGGGEGRDWRNRGEGLEEGRAGAGGIEGRDWRRVGCYPIYVASYVTVNVCV